MSTTELGVKTRCNLCHADDFTVLFPASVAQVNQIVRCNQCGLMYANPRKEADHVEIQSWPDDPDWDFEKEHRSAHGGRAHMTNHWTFRCPALLGTLVQHGALARGQSRVWHGRNALAQPRVGRLADRSAA